VELAGSLEGASRHPLARAFPGGQGRQVESHRNFPGEGIEACVAGRRVRIGTEAFCQALCAAPSPGPAHPDFGGSQVFLADERGWIAAFELADELRPEASSIVDALKRKGL